MKKAFLAELLKIRHSRVVWITFLAFAFAPLMGALFMAILATADQSQETTVLMMKARAMNMTLSWESYFSLLIQALAVAGILIFGFVASWIFGREYSDDTAKSLLSLPTSRVQILKAKFILYFLWCLGLTLSNLIIGMAVAFILDLPGLGSDFFGPLLAMYFMTSILSIFVGTPVALIAVWTKGYFGPLGFVAMVLVLSQILAAVGWGWFFPWSVPGLFSGAGGDFKEQLNLVSYSIVFITGVTGYLCTIYYWKYVDQVK